MIEHQCEAGQRVTSADIADVATALGAMGGGSDDAAELIDQIRCLEELKGAAAAAQARVTAAFAAQQRAAQRAAGVPADQVGKGIAAQVVLARRDSPNRGGRHLGLAQALVNELPETMAALAGGLISEWRATLVARETACLSAEHRRAVDAEPPSRRGGIRRLATRRSRTRPAGSGTGSTRTPSPAAPAARPPTGGSPCGPPRTPWPGWAP